MRYEFWLACRYLFAKRRERFISAIALLSIGGVALGVSALIVVLAVMSGFDHDLKDKLVGVNSHLLVDSPQGISEIKEVMRRVSGSDHVLGVSPFVSGQAILRLRDEAFGVMVRGLDPEREQRVSRLSEYVVIGRLPIQDDEVVIGAELSAYIQVGPGDRLHLISPVDGQAHEFSISGIFRSGMYEYDATLVGITLSRAQQFYKLGELVSGLSVRLNQLERAPTVKKTLQSRLGSLYNVRTWAELNPALFGALQVEKIVMSILLTLIIVVASLNIASMLIMVVMEKTKDIGILRALGATPASIAGLFLSQGCIVGFFGACLGLAGGFLLTWRLNDIVRWLEHTVGISLFPPTIYYLDRVPTQINSIDVIAIVTAAFLLSLIGGLYPAMRAARLAPVDALRYE